MANRKQRRTRRRNQRQSGGSPSVAYIGDTIMATGGAPLEVRTAQDPHCAGPDSLRPAPMTGGRSRRQRKSQRSQNQRQRNQRGGGCGCTGLQQRGGGSPAGGYYSQLSNEFTGKMLDGPVKYPCPTQMGGDPKQLINSYQTGYGLTVPVNTPSSNYMDYQSYGRQCMGGGKRQRKSKSKSRSRRSRR